MENDSEPIDHSEEIQKIIDADVPHIYSNGFNIVLGAGDVNIVLSKMGQNVATISLSFTVAKTLAEKLGGSIKTLEKVTDNTIMTTDDIEKSLSPDKDDTLT
jgi:hypothetical protein